MLDLEIYFSPVNGAYVQQGTEKLGSKVEIHTDGNFPEIEKNSLAIIYVPEYRNCMEVPEIHFEDRFRKEFYDLFPGFLWKHRIFDLGNLLPGNSIDDTYFALSNVVKELVKNSVVPIVVGGSQDLTYGIYKGFEHLEQLVNICAIDHRLDVGTPDEAFGPDNYVSHLLVQRPCYLFNFANIGSQAPFNSKSEVDLFEKLYFDVCRLGEFNADFKRAEPHLRNSDVLSIDVQSIRSSDYSSASPGNPNGFYADQICQISRYAGISDKLSVMGIFNLQPGLDSQNAHMLVAQIMWYFMDGYAQRKGDFPIGSKKDYMRFSVHMDDFSEEEIIFYKSNKSERWWMEVPYPAQNGQKYLRHHLVPCDYEDYQRTMKNEIPDLWWKTYQKLG